MKINLLKIISCTIFVFSYLSGAELESANDAFISPQCPETVNCGEKITIPIEITNSPKIASFGMDIVFSPELTYENCEKEGCLTEGFQFLDCNVSSQTGHLKIGGFSIEPIAEGCSGCLVNVIFTIDSECIGPLIISLTNLVDDIKGLSTQSCEIVIEPNITTTTSTLFDSTTSTIHTSSSTTTIEPNSTTTSSTSSSTTTSLSLLWPTAYDKMWGVKKDENLLLLRAFRDESLLNTEVGRAYIFMLYDNSLEIAVLLLLEPSLAEQTKEVINELLMSVESLRYHDEIEITQDTLDNLLSLLDQFEAKASPKLKTTIKRVKGDITTRERFEQLGIIISE